VHYGAREFYGNTPPKQGDASPGNQKEQEQNPDGSLATRGDWWQGMYYLDIVYNLYMTKYM
jgi:hypothetical protein